MIYYDYRVFRELRSGQTLDAKQKVESPSGVVSTAEATHLLTSVTVDIPDMPPLGDRSAMTGASDVCVGSIIRV
jgi:hypothetical protein